MSMPETTYFIQAIKDITKDNSTLARTLAKVTGINNNGLTVNLELVEKILGLQEYKNVPVVKNPRCNVPIVEGDFVLLLTLSHLLENFLETESFNSIVNIESYIALPFATMNSFTANNEFTIVTPDDGFTIIANDDAVTITQKDSGVKIEISNKAMKVESQEVSISAKNSLSLTSNSPIEIGNSTNTIGSVLADLINFLMSATTGVCANGSSTTTINSAQLTQLSQILTNLQSVVK